MEVSASEITVNSVAVDKRCLDITGYGRTKRHPECHLKQDAMHHPR